MFLRGLYKQVDTQHETVLEVHYWRSDKVQRIIQCRENMLSQKKAKWVSITMNLKGENVEETSNYAALLICFVLASNQASLSARYKIPVWISVVFPFLLQ